PPAGRASGGQYRFWYRDGGRPGRAREQALPRPRVEEVETVRVDGELKPAAGRSPRPRVDAAVEERLVLDEQRRVVLRRGLEHVRSDPRRVDVEEDVGVGAELLEDGDLDIDSRQPGRCEGSVLEALGPDAEDHLARLQRRPASRIERHAELAEAGLAVLDPSL